METPVYHTENYSLKPYRLEDEDRYIEMILDPACQEYMGNIQADEAAEREFYKKIFEIYEKKWERWFWIWGIFEGDKLCGHLELKETQHTKADELEIVYMVHPEERKRGLMTEVLNFLKENQGTWARKITATVDLKNENSISTLKKWGIDSKEILEEEGEKFYKLVLK